MFFVIFSGGRYLKLRIWSINNNKFEEQKSEGITQFSLRMNNIERMEGAEIQPPAQWAE